MITIKLSVGWIEWNIIFLDLTSTSLPILRIDEDYQTESRDGMGWDILLGMTSRVKRYIFVFSLKCITGFKHKYPYNEFNSENPKKTSYWIWACMSCGEKDDKQPDLVWRLKMMVKVKMLWGWSRNTRKTMIKRLPLPVKIYPKIKIDQKPHFIDFLINYFSPHCPF